MEASSKSAMWRALGITAMVLISTGAYKACNPPKPVEIPHTNFIPDTLTPKPATQQPEPVEQPATKPINFPQHDEGPLLDDQGRERKIINDINVLRLLLAQFWSQELAQIYKIQLIQPLKFEYYHTTGNPPCGGEQFNGAKNAYWCPPDRTLEFDMDFMKEFLVEHPGGASTFYIIAHEYGHAVQTSWQTYLPGQDKWEPSYKQELSADCLAGVFISRELAAGKLVSQAGDYDALFATITSQNMGGPWLEPSQHGTMIARSAAFEMGFNEANTDRCRMVY